MLYCSPSYLSIKTVRECYKKGQEVYISYGNKSNRELLLNYGFCMPHNVYNYALVSIKDLNEFTKATFIEEFQISEETYFAPEHYYIRIYFDNICISIVIIRFNKIC